ncbi:hypothetical protein L596_029199 [Steinernema carpocapsae]|uniref:DUF7087 domain-containing protein n=1 Tax=Steinernema carpocapsae TaxID=34508 RepID=A0A4V5ZXF0_STECR|nr:hypothetical protein L596_029199 [Steinernema carpocapsae]
MFSVGHKSIDHSFPAMIYQLRAAELVACLLQILVLYMEQEQIGFGNFLLPSLFLVGQGVIVFNRWYNEIDGRYDFQQIMSEKKDSHSKLQYAIGLFGGFILAVLVHMVAVDMHSGLSSFVFRFADYIAILSSAFCAAVESFEGAKAKYT